ncbi:MAG: GNAT family N-acetyltransferase [Candidatus Thorarchaeota archaeon]|nr:MAG: GNAT family N-acetyltransferase [Candidatus Thorarchaeota archaeon]
MKPSLQPLKESHIPDIIEISKTTWDGHDHLPHIIGEWLNNPLCHPFVFESDGKAIGVANIRIIDEGKTAWLEGLRVHADARQKGLGEKMTHHLIEVASGLNVQRLRLVTSGDNIAPLKIAASAGLKQMTIYQVFWKDLRSKINWKYDAINVSKIEPEKVPEFVEQNPNLMPLNVIMFHWDVFEATPQKIQDLGKSLQYWAGSNENGAILSVGGKQPWEMVMDGGSSQWCFTLYATSPEAFLSGLSKNLEIAQELGIQNIMCIHPSEFVSSYSSIKWLKQINHELRLVLHEKIL